MSRFDKLTNRELVFLHNALVMRKDADSESVECRRENEKLCRSILNEIHKLSFERNIVDLYGRCGNYDPNSTSKIQEYPDSPQKDGTIGEDMLGNASVVILPSVLDADLVAKMKSEGK